MSDIEIYRLTQENAKDAAGILLPEVVQALKEDKPVTVLAAMDGNTVIGALGGAVDGGAFEIASLFVHPDHRRRGAGQKLIWSLQDIMEDELVIKADYNVENEDNKTLRPFFDSMGFKTERAVYPSYYIASLNRLRTSSIIEKEEESILYFSEVPDSLIRAASNTGFEKGYPMPEGGLLAANIDKHMSFCVVKDDKMSAYVAVEPIDEEMVKVSALWSETPNPKELIVMLSRMLRELRAKYRPETRVAMLAMNSASYKLIQYMFRDVEPSSYSVYLV
ncbi:MAG: GNAT family N-acetyltransferase [Lachnospiraceae bacterium]|nr:GNAT family N-acetyltransferase [Lachnospiraceae bacterium]